MTEQMKPSGIERIGDIPHDWEISKIKYNVLIPVTDGPHETPVFVEEGIPFYSVDGIQNDHLVYEPCRYISYADANRYDAKAKPTYGDILMGKAASVGKIAIIDQHVRLQVWSPLAIIRTDEEKVHNQYLRYYLLSDPAQVEIDLKSTTNTQKNIAMEDIENLIITKPSIEEQKAITFFLNTQCAKIDGIIADIEKQIETLQKYKKSLITETVTKGLDKSVPMKNSGIEWIGEIPKHWGVNKTRYLANLCSGATPSKDVYSYWEGDIPWISSQEVKNDIIADTSLHISEEAVRSCSTKLMPAGTLVMVVRSGILQHTIPVSLLGVPATINQDIKAFVFKPEMIPAFYKYYIQGENDALLNVLIKDKTTVESIDNNLLLSLRVMVPPIQEQKEIVSYLDKKCDKINSIITDKQAQLDAIIQHKKSLIYEYVTGKKRVTEVN